MTLFPSSKPTGDSSWERAVAFAEYLLLFFVGGIGLAIVTLYLRSKAFLLVSFPIILLPVFQVLASMMVVLTAFVGMLAVAKTLHPGYVHAMTFISTWICIGTCTLAVMSHQTFSKHNRGIISPSVAPNWFSAINLNLFDTYTQLKPDRFEELKRSLRCGCSAGADAPSISSNSSSSSSSSISANMCVLTDFTSGRCSARNEFCSQPDQTPCCDYVVCQEPAVTAIRDMLAQSQIFCVAMAGFMSYCSIRNVLHLRL